MCFSHGIRRSHARVAYWRPACAREASFGAVATSAAEEGVSAPTPWVPAHLGPQMRHAGRDIPCASSCGGASSQGCRALGVRPKLPAYALSIQPVSWLRLHRLPAAAELLGRMVEADATAYVANAIANHGRTQFLAGFWPVACRCDKLHYDKFALIRGHAFGMAAPPGNSALSPASSQHVAAGCSPGEQSMAGLSLRDTRVRGAGGLI